MTRLVVVGAGGHARVVLSLLSYREDITVIGVADRDKASLGEVIGNTSVTITWDDLPFVRKDGVDAVALAIGDNALRGKMYDCAVNLGFQVPGLRHPTSMVERSVEAGAGCIFCAGSLICAEARLEEDVLVNTGAIVDHECRIGKHAHIAPGVRLAGRVTVGQRAFVGLGSSVIDHVRIGDDVIVGAGSVVVEDLPDGVVAWGSPARVMKRR